MRITTYHASVPVIKNRRTLSEALKQLADYEDTGLTPEQVRALRNNYMKNQNDCVEKMQ